MDTVDKEKRNEIFLNRKSKLEAKASNFKIQFFQT